MNGRAVIAVVGICATLGGCGDSGGSGSSKSSLTRHDVAQQGRQWLKAQAKKNVSVAVPICFEDPDADRWRCATDLHRKAGGAATHITFMATCDGETCLNKIVFRAGPITIRGTPSSG